VLRLADTEGLTIVTIHTHLHDGQPEFSVVDDRAECVRAEAIEGAFGNRVSMASIVYDRTGCHLRARFWRRDSASIDPVPVKIVSSLADVLGDMEVKPDQRFDRQVRAFGSVFQTQLHNMRIGMVGLGGLGAMIVEGLTRLGVRRWVLVDPDRVAVSNLNRLTGATRWDAIDAIHKVDVARRNIRAMHAGAAEIRAVTEGLPSRKTTRLLAGCDVIVGATDNHRSRLLLQEIGSAYLRPLVNAGVGLTAISGKVRGIGVRVTAPPIGGPWCLICGGIVDPFEASKEQCDEQHRRMLQERGYLSDTPQPAVYWVNGVAANLAVRLIHSLVMPFSDQMESTDLYADLYQPEFLQIDHDTSRSDCLACGPDGGGLRGIGDVYLDRHTVPLEELELRTLRQREVSGDECARIEQPAAIENAEGDVNTSSQTR